MREPDDSGSGPQASGIRFLVESALRKVALDKQGGDIPKSRGEWIARLCAALTDESEAAHQRVIASMVANGISSNEIYQTYVPDAARFLGEMWVQDKASLSM